MKKIYCLLVASFVFTGIAEAQDKIERIKLERNVELLESVDLGEGGLLIKTGKNYPNSKKLDWKIRYYSPELDLVYEVPIEKTQINKGFGNPIVAAPDGAYVYHFEYKGYNTTIGAKKQHVTQINKEGKVKTYEVENIKELGHIKMGFCDNTYLYFLATENGDENHPRKKSAEKLLLNKVKHSDLSSGQVALNLPELGDAGEATFWTYAGHEEGQVFLASKTIQIEEGKYSYRLLTLDPDGNVIRDVTLDFSLADKHIRPSNNVKVFKGNSHASNDDFYAAVNSSSSFAQMEARIGAFGGIKVNPKTNSIHVYGLYGSKPFKSLGSLNEGFFLHKYDFEGKLLWKVQEEFPETLTNDNAFRLHEVPFSRAFLLKENADQSQQLHFMFKKRVYTYHITSAGEFEESYWHFFEKTAGVEEANMCFSPSLQVKSREYFQDPKKKEKNTFYQYFTSAKGECVFEYKPRKQKLDLLYFRRPK